MITELPDFIANPDPEIYLSDKYLVLDMENAHYGGDFPDATNPDADVLLTCYMSNGDVMRHKWGNEYEIGHIIDLIYEHDFIVAHNSKHELGWLARAGLDLTKVIVYDTQIAEYVIAGNRRMPLDLGSVAKRYGYPGKESFIDRLMRGGVCPSEMPRTSLLRRCVYDVNTTNEVFKKQRERLKDEGLLNVFFSRCIFTPVLADIESNGVCLDKDVVTKLYSDALERRRAIEEELAKFSTKVKWSSPKQVADFLYDELKFPELTDSRGKPLRTSTGRRTAKKEDIAKLKCKTKKQKKFVDTYNKLSVVNAELSKSLDFFYGVCTEGDCKFTARFHQTVTATHRLSSTGKPIVFELFGKKKSVQFQNCKREFKKAFRSRYPGWFVAEADGAGMEFRGAAELAKDMIAIQAIRERFDVHAYTASIVFEDKWNAAQEIEDEDERKVALKRIRQDAKPFTFKPLYGGTSGTPAERAYYAAFKEKYPDIAALQDRWVDEAMSTKELKLLTGLKAYFPYCRMTSSGYVEDNTKVRNLPVQQFATADIIPVAMTYMWHLMKANNMKSFMVNTIHDSTITELHPDEVNLYQDITRLSFLDSVYYYFDKVYNYRFDCPLGVEIKAGTHWTEDDGIKEVLYEKEPTYAKAA